MSKRPPGGAPYADSGCCRTKKRDLACFYACMTQSEVAEPEPAELVQRAQAAGATEIILRPAASDRVEGAVRSILRITALEGEIARIRRKIEGRPQFSDIIAGSPEIQRAMMLARRAAD